MYASLHIYHEIFEALANSSFENSNDNDGDDVRCMIYSPGSNPVTTHVRLHTYLRT